jgi:hypothetical protein
LFETNIQRPSSKFQILSKPSLWIVKSCTNDPFTIFGEGHLTSIELIIFKSEALVISGTRINLGYTRIKKLENSFCYSTIFSFEIEF